MASIIIKSEERKMHEAFVAKSFGVTGQVSKEHREAAECIAAKSREAYEQAKRMEGRRCR